MNTRAFKRVFAYVKNLIPELKKTRLTVTDEFCFNYKENYIAVMLPEYATNDDKIWENFMLDYVDAEYNFNIQPEEMDLFSLLHEIGHQQTFYDFTPDDLVKYVDALDAIPEGNNPDDLFAYRQLSLEKAADEWAIEFMRQHRDDLLELI